MDVSGTYDMVSSEKFDEFLKEMGVGMALRTIAGKTKPTFVVTQTSPDKYTFKSISTFKTTEITFTLGQEFEEERADSAKVKSTITREGNTFTHCQKGEKTDCKIIREFTDTGIRMECICNNVTAVRVYEKKK